MRVTVAAVGRVKERGVRETIDEYVSRIGHYVPFEEKELADLPLEKLGAAVEKAAKGAQIVPLDASGRGLSSEGFASQLERFSLTGKGEVCFVIGGKHGLPREMLQRAPLVLSLSAMTFPHRLARLMLCEQIYRGLSLLRNEPYGL